MKRAEPVSGTNIKAVQDEQKKLKATKEEDVREFRLLVDRPKAGTANPGFAEPGFAEPGFAEPGFAEPKLAESGLVESGLAESGLAEPGLAEPGLAEAGIMAGSFANLLGQAARENFSGESAEPSAILAACAGVGVHGAPVLANVEVAAETPDVGNQRCEELVERILVAQSSADGTAEVRIRLDRSWLPDTEVRLVRPPDGSLDVEFMSEQVESQRFLMPNLSDLRERLGNRIGVPVTVRMSEQADSDPGDGRSRNRRNLYEEMDENP